MEALQRLHNRGSISTGYDIDNSCKFQRDGEYLKAEGRSQGTQTTWTYSTWVKRTDLADTNEPYQNIFSAGSSSSNWCHAYFRGDGPYPDNQIFLYLDNGGSQFWLGRILESFRDTSAWLHFVLAVDTTQSTTTDRAKVYINGVQKTISNYTAPTQNASTRVGDGGGKFAIGALTDAGHSFNGYIAECVLVDGSQLAATSFGEFDEDSGIWKPKDVSSLSLGTTGFYINFDDSSNMGKVTSGNNGSNFDKYSIDSTNQATDTPTNNFCTLNPLFVGNQSTPPSDGATYMSDNGTNQDVSYAGTMGVTKGKWYYETYIDMRSTSYGLAVYAGYHTFKDNYRANAYWSSTNQASVALYGMHTGQYWTWNGGSRSVTSGLGSIGTSGVGKFVGIALNLDDNQISFYYDGSAVTNGTNLALNNLGTDTDAGIFAIPAISVYDNNHTVNFGGYTKASISSAQSDENGYGTFEHAPPSGYYALCTKNLEEYG